MELGITATQQGATIQQLRTLGKVYVAFRPTKVHHGDCVGGDVGAALLADAMGIQTVAHPPLNEQKRAFHKSTFVLPSAAYLDRNHDIVHVTQLLVGMPKDWDWPSNFRGQGTWSTLNYARRQLKHFAVILPDGSVGPQSLLSPSMADLIRSRQIKVLVP